MTDQHQPTRPVHATGEEAYVFLGVQMRILLSGHHTGGQFNLVEAVMPPGGDGGLHVHDREDESLYLLAGELAVTIGDEQFTLRAGESYFAPRGIPHRLQNKGTADVRALLINTPGNFDGFIREAGVPLAQAAQLPAGPPPPEMIARILALSAAYGVRIIAPPAF